MRIIGRVSLLFACLACGSSNTKSAASPVEVEPQYHVVDLPHPEVNSMLPSGCKDDGAKDCLPPTQWVNKLCSGVHPEVALLDVGMPGLTGLEVAAKIREAPWGREMVLIALTGWGQDEDRRRTKEAGFDHHLTKPVTPDTIEELIRRS